MKTIQAVTARQSQLYQFKATQDLESLWLTSVLFDNYVELSGEISDNMCLDPGFYQVSEEDLTIMPGATLKVRPGTVIEFAMDRKCIVKGTLDVSDVEITPVFFRGRNNCTWGGIDVYSDMWEPAASALLRHAIIEHAEEAVNVGPRASVTIEENCCLRKNTRLSHYMLGQCTIQCSEIFDNKHGWTVQSIGRDPHDEERCGHLILRRNIIHSTKELFSRKDFGRITQQANFIAPKLEPVLRAG